MNVPNWDLEQKEIKSRRILREAIERFGSERIAVAWSGGKDLLNLK